MGNCSTCPSKSSCNASKSEENSCGKISIKHGQIKNVIGVISGKGGVGKSTVTSLIAKKLNKEGYKVGILDADITGPSIPRLMGVQDQRAFSSNGVNIYPVITKDNIKTMSVNFMVNDETQPVVLKGPMLSNTVQQFYRDVMWEDLDYLLIDMPPGTGDVALAVMQSIPLTGMIMVSVPQDMISMIVAKGVNMAKNLNVNILGVVENMSYVQCPDCDKKIKLFNGDGTEKLLSEMNLKLLGELPMTREIIEITHKGVDETSKELDNILSNIVENISK